MNGQACFDFSHVPDEKLFDPERLFMVGREAEERAWNDEKKRRKEAQRLDLERIEQERLARRNAIKAAIPYSEALAHEICERVSAGEFLTLICQDSHMPPMRNCTQWLRNNLDFVALYKQSIDDRRNIFEDEVVTISDDVKLDFKVVVKNGKERKVPDPEVIARAKLRVDVRFRHLKAYRPSRWGEASTLTVKNEGDTFDPASMTAEELNKTIADIERKARVVKEPKAA